MFSTPVKRPVLALDTNVVAFLRPWLRTSGQIPAPPYQGASAPTPEQALLLLSLTYGEGIRLEELPRVRVGELLAHEGTPNEHVRIDAEWTRQRRSRRAPAHPDVRRDVNAFIKRHPGEQFAAFVPLVDGGRRSEPMSGHGLGAWFRDMFRRAGLEGLTANSGRLMFNANQRRH